MKSTLIVLKYWSRLAQGWKVGLVAKKGCVTSSGKAVNTVGGSQENGIIHVLVVSIDYLSVSASLSLFYVMNEVLTSH